MLLFLQLYWALISLKSSLPNVICKKVFLKISRISQKKNCAGVCIYNKIAAARAPTLLKKILPYRFFFSVKTSGGCFQFSIWRTNFGPICLWHFLVNEILLQKQPSRGVIRKRCSKNMKQIYRRTPLPQCDFNKVAVNLQHFWRAASASFMEISLHQA